MRCLRIVLPVAGALAAFGLSGCLPQFGCGDGQRVELRNLVYGCVESYSLPDPDLDSGSAPSTTLLASPNPAEAGTQVTFIAGDIDIDGDVVAHDWDVDGNDEYETHTGQGVRTSRTYLAGEY